MAYIAIVGISTAGNAIICALFGIQCLIHTFLGIYYRRWRFVIFMFLGTSISCVGYAGRSWFSRDDVLAAYIMQAVCVAVGPGFTTGAIKGLLVHFASYMRMKKIDGENDWFMDKGLQRFEYYEQLNKFLNIASSVLIGTGIGVFSGASPGSDMQNAVRVTLAGFAVQLGLVIITLVLWAIFTYNSRDKVFITRKVRVYLFGTFIAFICITIRLSYRVAEWAKILHDGLANNLTLNENYLLCLDAMTILLAGTILILLHPGFVFGKAELQNIDAHFHEYDARKKEAAKTRKAQILKFVPIVRHFV